MLEHRPNNETNSSTTMAALASVEWPQQKYSSSKASYDDSDDTLSEDVKD